MEKKMLPIGIEYFSDIVTQGYYYVDKTGMIKELIENRGYVNLFTRPRRFGKSLNMNMLKSFFEIGADKSLFEGLAISKETKLCEEYMGKYPVISVSFKTVEGLNYHAALKRMKKVIGDEASRFDFLRSSDRLSEDEKIKYGQLTAADTTGYSVYSMSEDIVIGSLNTLSSLLAKHFQKKCIILIDEYDVPLAKANKMKYYDEMIVLIRGMLNEALKTNPNLEFAVLTGCLRVSKESIFTGLNNPKMYTLLDARCEEYFGFTDDEVRELLAYYELEEYIDITKEWYDGYMIGNTNVYNPWDVMNWVDQLLTDTYKLPKNHWANSSGNEEVHQFIQKMGDGVTKAEIERLISGETVQKKIEEQLTYDTMYDSIENMWSLLYTTGYLTQSEPPQGDLVRLVIPNTEVRNIFSDSVLKQFEKRIEQDGTAVSAFCEALKVGNAAEVERLFTELMKNTVSIRDTAVEKTYKENFYHGMLIGIFKYKSDWGVVSNRESGDGYYDIAIEIENEGIGIVIEVKYAENEQFDKECRDALKQINNKHYTDELKEDGMKTILKYGIACYKKRCKAVVEYEA